jgi:hypothetical protein
MLCEHDQRTFALSVGKSNKSLGNEYFIVLNKRIISNENKHG